MHPPKWLPGAEGNARATGASLWLITGNPSGYHGKVIWAELGQVKDSLSFLSTHAGSDEGLPEGAG